MRSKIILFEKKEDCCGCTACVNICPKSAIAMQPDGLGFLYPVIDETKCIKCGLCKKVCAFNADYDKNDNFEEPYVYAVRHKDINEIATSRSGAVFIALSDWILANNGVIYGVGYTGHFRVVHKRAVNKPERDEFKGSKYVQSDLTGVFRQVKADLKAGLLVMFSGTPCQTAGLNSYVGKKLRETLYLVDIVCHGVPGPFIWRDYLAYLERKHGDKICWVNFRDKQLYGWTAHQESFKFVNGGGKMTFTYTFYKHIMFRHSCGVCPYTNTRRPSDITLADFWGWEKTDPTFNADDKGVSLVLINTEKGRKLFEAVKDNMNIIPVKLENCLQPNLQHPSIIHPKRMAFERDYARKGFEYVMKKYGDMGWRYRVRRILGKVKRIMKRVLRK